MIKDRNLHIILIILFFNLLYSQQICYTATVYEGSNYLSLPILNDSLLTYSDILEEINSQENCEDVEGYEISFTGLGDSLFHYNSFLPLYGTTTTACEFEICGIPSDPCIYYDFDEPYNFQYDIDSTYIDSAVFVYSFPVLIEPSGNLIDNLSIFVDEVDLQQIIGQGASSVYSGEFGGFIGSLQNISYEGGYYLRVGNPQSIEYCGYPYAYEFMGDIDQDGDIIITDIIQVMNHILNLELLNDYGEWAANLSFDYSIDILDVIKLVNIILN